MSIDSFSDLRHKVAANREIKKEVREKDLELSGHRGVELEQYMTEILSLARVMLDSNRQWVEEKFASLHDFFDGVSENEIEEAFFQGLQTNITQYYRLFKKTRRPDLLLQLHDPEFQNQLVETFFVDFILVLRKSGKNNTTPTAALRMARQSYINNPDVIAKLQKQFPDADIGVLVKAASLYPTKAAEYVKQVNDNIAALSVRFPELQPSLIKHVASSYLGDPGAFIDEFKQRIANLLAVFPNVDRNIVEIAAVARPKRSEKFVLDVLKKIDDLTKEFPNADMYIIKKAATFHFEDPRSYLKDVLEKIDELRVRFPDLNLSDIKIAVVDHYGSCEDHLNEIRAKRKIKD